MSSSYLHPHDEINVTDNTVVSITETSNTGKVLFQAYPSEQGDDSKIITWDNYDKFILENGEPKINTTMQAMHHAALWLKNGGILKGIRITAKDAVRANTVLMLKIKIVEEQKTDGSGNPLYTDKNTGADTVISTGNTPIMVKRAKVKKYLKALKNPAVNRTDVETILRGLVTVNEETLEYEFPLFAVVCRGKGSYGKYYRWRMTLNPNRDKLSGYRNYYFEILKNDTRDGLYTLDNFPVNVSLYPDATYNSKIQYFLDLVNSTDGSPVQVYAVDDYWHEITELLLPIIQQENPETVQEKVDYVMFYNEDLSSYEYIDEDVTSLDVSAVEGFALQNGSDGSFAKTNKTREDDIRDRYLDLFEGKIDPSINDVKEHTIDIALDANYPLEVKKAMIAWRNKRKDFPLILDAGTMYSLSDLKSFLSDDMSPDDYNILINTQTFDTKDPFTGRITKVTMNYLYAALMPEFLANNKNDNTPFAGISVPLNDYIIEGSLLPVISEESDKSDIYKLRGNYIEKEGSTYTLGTNVTSQLVDSELSYLNNVMIFHDMRKDFKSLGAVLRFKDLDSDEDIQTLNKLAQNKLDEYVGTRIKNGSVTVAKSATDPREKTAKTTIKVGFTSFILDNVFDFTIERM